MDSLLFRALNEYDIKYIDYGIFGKQLISDNKNSNPNKLKNSAEEQLSKLKNSKIILHFLRNKKEVHEFIVNNIVLFGLLGKTAFDYYSKNGINDFFDVSKYIVSLGNEYNKVRKDLNTCIYDNITFADMLTVSYYNGYCYSLINSHLANYKDIETSNLLDDWISFGFSISDIERYYLDQKDKHAIAVIENNIDDDSLISERFHNKEEAERLASKVLNQEFKVTSVDYLAYSYYQAIYFSYIPKEKIKSILGALEVDLLINNMYNESLIDVEKEDEEARKELAKEKIRKRFLDENKTVLADIFTEVYIRNVPVNKLADTNKYKNKLGFLLDAKRKILSNIDCYNDFLICKNNAPQKILLMEEKYLRKSLNYFLFNINNT